MLCRSRKPTVRVDRGKRRTYANLLNYSHHLIVVDDGTNQTTKSDRDPAGYLPIDSFQCGYVEIWLRIKRTWGLNMDQSEPRFPR